MITVNTNEAKVRLSELIELVISGRDQVVICLNGKPAVDLTAHVESPSSRLDPLQIRPELACIQILGDPTAPIDEEAWPEAFQ